MQVPEICELQQKNAFRSKKFITQSGKEIFFFGYEPQAYTKLLEQYSENEIKHRKKDMPEIWYYGEDGKRHRYYPDFYIPKDNLIIKVKSEWTYNASLKINLLKEQACIKAGYNYNFLILERNGKSIENSNKIG